MFYRVLGARSGFKDRCCGIKQGFVRGTNLLLNIFRFSPDIVYFTCAPSVGFAFRDATQIFLCKILGRRVVVHLRGGNIEGFWGGGILRRFCSNFGSRLADYIFVITRDCEKFARQKFGNSKVMYIPNYIDCNTSYVCSRNKPAEFKDDKFSIIHVAFQCKEKGTFEIIESAKYLPDNVKMLLIGVVSEDNRIEIINAIEKYGVSNKIELVGSINKPLLWDYYKNADLFLFPSYSEGFPNVIMEAMFWRLPILTTDVGAIGEITEANRENPAAIILKKNNPPSAIEIAERVKEMMGSSTLRNRLSENAYNRVTKYYSVDVVLPQLESVLSCIMNNGDVLNEAKKYFEQNEI